MRGICGGILALACVLAPARSPCSELVEFAVDGEFVATLESDYPTEGLFEFPLKLSGRSGVVGADERSGLFDNSCVSISWAAHGWSYWVDDFGGLDTLMWKSYGGPEPSILEDFGNPAPCLMAGGNAYFASGVYTVGPACPDWGHMSFSVDAYVDSAAPWHDIEFGVADVFAASGEPGEQTLGLVVGFCWTLDASGQSVLVCMTDLGHQEVPAEQWLGGWHQLAFYTTYPSPVEPTSWSRVKLMFR